MVSESKATELPCKFSKTSSEESAFILCRKLGYLKKDCRKQKWDFRKRKETVISPSPYNTLEEIEMTIKGELTMPPVDLGVGATLSVLNHA